MQVLHILNKKTPTLVGVKLCKSVYIFSWATVPVYIYTGTVAHLSLKKIILFVRYKNFIFALFFSLSSHWAHQCLSQVSASLSLLSSSSHIYSLKLFLILITTRNNNVISLGVLQPREEGGSINRRNLLYWQTLGLISLKRYGFFSLRF